MRRLKVIEAFMPRPLTTTRDDRRYGRNVWTRTLDALFAAARRYALPVHCVGVVISAAALYLYARLTAFTVQLVTHGERRWPDIPSPCVLALWHAGAPSLLVALAKRRPRPRLAIMVAHDPRGDCVALLCRMLGLRVVRGESGEGGWPALAELAREVGRGSCALITADGGGPARSAKVGAVALASATGVPLVAVGADCRPAVFERRKWDRARNPVPFGRVSVSLGRSRRLPALASPTSVERARRWLQSALDESAETARRAARRFEPSSSLLSTGGGSAGRSPSAAALSSRKP